MDSTKLAIELITGCTTSAFMARTMVFSPSEMHDLFFEYFVGKDRDVTPHEELSVLGVTMAEVDWDIAFEKIVLDNIKVTPYFGGQWSVKTGTTFYFGISLEINTNL